MSAFAIVCILMFIVGLLAGKYASNWVGILALSCGTAAYGAFLYYFEAGDAFLLPFTGSAAVDYSCRLMMACAFGIVGALLTADKSSEPMPQAAPPSEMDELFS